jgi:hypothetical protein
MPGQPHPCRRSCSSYRVAARSVTPVTREGTVNLDALVADLADRGRAGRTEADVQSGVKALLLAAPFSLDDGDILDRTITLEAQAGQRRRIDVEVGATVIEVKKDLRVGNVRSDAVDQLSGYVRQRSEVVDQRYVGVLTDGAEWHLYHLDDGQLELVTSCSVDSASPDVDRLLGWLEGVLATSSRVHPTPDEIGRRLGAASSAHALDSADLSALYDSVRDEPTVRLKRELWGRLLTTALGTAFSDTDELFVNHTLLVLTAEAIAHALIGYDLTDPELSPERLCAGSLFSDAQIRNVVEPDFFDWPAEVAGGHRFVRTLARRLARFAWEEVDYDVMKVLYESVISAETRHSLGEYYTPDWLASHIVDAVVGDPLTERVMDPSAGSGTFLFHAVRRYLDAADAAGRSNADAVLGVCSHVVGIDVHPVAVAFARVTYLLAIGMDRITADDRPPLSVPVYLGDSVQWSQKANMLTADALTIETSSSPGTLFAEPLRFPRRLLDDPVAFDRLVEELAAKAANRKPNSKPPVLDAVFGRFGVADAEGEVLTATFQTMCDLHDSGRDHIWGYFTRNLARPVWFARPENAVDVLIGNPPWLSYRFMTEAMQSTFRSMTSERGMWAGASVSTHQDLSALFVVRATELYLRPGGRFGFVMPLAALSRKQFAGFRTGSFSAPEVSIAVEFDTPWDLHAVKPSIFPVPASVVFGSRAERPRPLSSACLSFSGRIPAMNASWKDAESHLVVEDASVGVSQDGVISPYASRFAQGASIVPRMLFCVVDGPSSPLGAGAGRRSVVSRRSNNEKKPWKQLPGLVGNVERQFVFDMHLGETLLPFRLQEPWMAVIPWDGERLLEPDDHLLDDYPGFASWWREANRLWLANRGKNILGLLDQLDYRKKLSQQMPLAAHRVVYPGSGQYLAAARLDDPNIVIDTKLYWAAVSGEDEGRYLTAVLNSDAMTNAVRPFQSRGEHNPRDFHKYVFQVPIPVYDEANSVHADLVAVAARAETIVAAIDLPSVSFQAQRRLVRETLGGTGVAAELDELVAQLLSD